VKNKFKGFNYSAGIFLALKKKKVRKKFETVPAAGKNFS
jgi:hypothetical protein